MSNKHSKFYIDITKLLESVQQAQIETSDHVPDETFSRLLEQQRQYMVVVQDADFSTETLSKDELSMLSEIADSYEEVKKNFSSDQSLEEKKIWDSVSDSVTEETESRMRAVQKSAEALTL